MRCCFEMPVVSMSSVEETGQSTSCQRDHSTAGCVDQTANRTPRSDDVMTSPLSSLEEHPVLTHLDARRMMIRTDTQLTESTLSSVKHLRHNLYPYLRRIRCNSVGKRVRCRRYWLASLAAPSCASFWAAGKHRADPEHETTIIIASMLL